MVVEEDQSKARARIGRLCVVALVLPEHAEDLLLGECLVQPVGEPLPLQGVRRGLLREAHQAGVGQHCCPTTATSHETVSGATTDNAGQQATTGTKTPHTGCSQPMAVDNYCDTRPNHGKAAHWFILVWGAGVGKGHVNFLPVTVPWERGDAIQKLIEGKKLDGLQGGWLTLT